MPFLASIRDGLLQVPSVNIIAVSPPCQGFSSANSGGKNDETNKDVTASVADIAQTIEPLYLIMEQVTGCVSTTRVLVYVINLSLHLQ